MKFKYCSTALILSAAIAFAPMHTIAADENKNRLSEQSSDGFVVKQIDVLGLQRMELGDFFNILPLQVGEILDSSRIPIIIRSIYKTGNFADIRLFRDGNKLIIDLLERPTISDITIEGNSDIETEQILDAMRKSGFAKGEVYDPSIVKNIKEGIEEQYFAHGKYSVKIKDRIIRQSRNRVLVKFEIDEGDPAKIQAIRIVGNHVFDDKELLDQFELSPGAWYEFFSSSDQYAKEKLTGDLETLRSYYMDRGYLQFQETSTQVSISPDRKGVYITINIEEGEKYKVKDVTFSGELILSEDQLRRILPLRKGDTYSAAAISFTEEQIKQNLGYFGYAFAKVVTVPDIDEVNKTVNINMFIDPGKKVYVNRINFIGNETTDDEVLRREVRLMEGGALSNTMVERSKLRLQRLTFLEEVEVETPKVEDSEDRVDINYRVKERSAGTISGGIGYGDTLGLSLNANVSHNNFLGTGKTIQFAVNKNRFSTSYNFNYLDPYFTIDGISAGAGAFFQASDFSEIGLTATTLDSLGIRGNIGYPVNEISQVSFGMQIEDNALDAVGAVSQQIIDFFEQVGLDPNVERAYDYQLYRFSTSYVRNTLNRGIFPDRGTRQAISLSATIPGSDLEFYKLDYTFDYYIPITQGWTFLTRFRASWGDGYGDGASSKLPYFENFSAGGSGTMRGFERNTIGPREIFRTRAANIGTIPGTDIIGTANPVGAPTSLDTITISRRAVGGNARVLSSLELIFPIPFVEQANSVRTSFFVDIGNLWDTNFDLNDYSDVAPEELAKIPDYSDPNTYRVSTGISLQWLSPMGPLTISLSTPLKKEEGDLTETFSFNVGTTF